MSMTRPFATLIGLLVMLPVLCGCGRSDGPVRYPVMGTITFRGEPLDQGTIQFTPTANRGIGSGAIVSNGEYSLPREKGLPAGEYRVMIFSADLEAAPIQPEDGPPGSAKLMPERIPPEYNSQSKITREVEPGEENKFDFDIDG